jgi:putative PIG3 family NAD(P)H quinone oxidoreductase
VPGNKEVLIRVRASALNRAELLQRQGQYPAPPGAPADIPGMEFAGEVAALGADVPQWREGDRVFGIVGGGGNAEYLVTDAQAVARVPANLDWINAAAVPEAFITAHDAMIVQAGLRSGENVLIHAAASGVGLAAGQLARALGASPYGTTRSAGKGKKLSAYGFSGSAWGADPERLSSLMNWPIGPGFDVAVDLVGGPYVALSIERMAPKGRIILVGSVAGRKLELDQSKIMSKRLTIIGTVLRARPLEEKIAATQGFVREVVPLLASGAVKPVIDSDYALADVQKAHARLESNETFGKVLLRMD